MQVDGIGGAAKYNGIVDCAKKSIATDGVGVLFRGLNSSLIRAFPTNAATFAVVTWTMKMFQEQQERDDMVSSHHSWREILASGEDLVRAAGVPAPLQLSLQQSNTSRWQGTMAVLPYVVAASNEDNEDDEDDEQQHQESNRKCWCEEKHRLYSMLRRIPNCLSNVSHNTHESFDSKFHSSFWSRCCDDVLSCTRPSYWALTKHQHNLSIVL